MKCICSRSQMTKWNCEVPKWWPYRERPQPGKVGGNYWIGKSTRPEEFREGDGPNINPEKAQKERIVWKKACSFPNSMESIEARQRTRAHISLEHACALLSLSTYFLHSFFLNFEVPTRLATREAVKSGRGLSFCVGNFLSWVHTAQFYSLPALCLSESVLTL